MRHLAALAFITGCGCYTRLPAQDEAEAIIWYQVYGMTDLPPPVEWFADWELARDVTGRTLIGWKVQVACGKGDIYGDGCGLPIRLTAWSHEAMHWRCWLLTGDVDAAHSNCNWSLVDRAAEAMAAAGMD
jgi:hypothetical protein